MRIKIKKPRVKKAAKWPVAHRWTALGTMLAYSAVSDKFSLAQAQDITRRHPFATGVAAQQNSLAVRLYNIPSGSLDQVLSRFKEITGLNCAAAQPELLNVHSPGATGLYTITQALNVLLTGTRLRFRFSEANTVVIELLPVATSVDVTAAVDALAESSPKFSQPALDTPQTITNVSQAVMAQQGVTTLRDALRNVAGISLAAGEGGAQGDNLTIRGFTARNDLFIDGMRDFGSYYRDPFNTQEVQVLQGPASVDFGRGSTGGVVNQSTKTAGLNRFLSFDADFGTDQTRRGTFDWDQPLSLFGKKAAFRLNVMGDENNVAGRDVAENRRFGVAPSLALGLGTPTRFNLSYFHQNANDIPDYGIPWLFNGPAPVNRANYYGFKNGNYLRTYDDIGTVKAEHDVNRHLTIRNQARYANYTRDVLITEAQIPSGVMLSTPLSAVQITRHEIGVASTETYLDEQLDVVANFTTAGIRHDLVAGIEAGRETSNPVRPTWTNVPSTSLLAPNPNQQLTGAETITSNVETKAITTAAYILDTIKLGRHWDLSGGFRWDRFNANYTQSVAPATAFQRIDDMPSWRTALVYEPVASGSFYFAAGTSLNPSAESLSLSASTASLPPEKNRTYELGTKWELPNRHFSLRAAVFQTTKLNAREPDPANPLLNVLAGTQRVNGAEMEVHARLTSRWDLLGSYANLDAKLISSTAYPRAIGAQLANVPRNTFNFWSTYRWPWRLESGFGGNYVSSRTASSTAPFDPVTGQVKQVPGYWVFNAMLSRRISEHVDLQLNANNLANRYYYDQLHPAHIILGAGRSALIGLKFKF